MLYKVETWLVLFAMQLKSVYTSVPNKEGRLIEKRYFANFFTTI